MTWPRATPALVIAGIFDLARLFFMMFWFFGPALLGVYCESKVGDVWVVGKVLAAGCAAGATTIGTGGFAVAATFGTIMAMAIGFAGWLTVGSTLVMTNTRIFKENERHALWFAFSLLISEVPIIGSIPGLTGVTIKMYHTQIKKDKEKLKKYKKELVEAQRQERDEKMADLMQARAAQLAEADIY